MLGCFLQATAREGMKQRVRGTTLLGDFPYGSAAYLAAVLASRIWTTPAVSES